MKSKKSSKNKFEPIKEVGIVRDRGQLTIPNEIRQVNKWIAKDTPVTMYAVDSETIVIKPIIIKPKTNKELYQEVLELRKRGNKNTNLTDFVINDRQTRR